MQKIRIHAVDDRRVSLIADDGHARRGRYAGRDLSGAALPDGEVVVSHDHYLRHARRGDLRLGTLDAPAQPVGDDEVPS